MMRLLALQLLFIATAPNISAAASCLQLSRITHAELSALRSNAQHSLPLSGLLVRLWCQDLAAQPAAGNYVNISFPQPVVIHGIIASGDYDRLGEDYHSFIRKSSFSYYNGTSLVTLPVNSVNTPNPVDYFFPEPIITEQLRYNMIEAEADVLYSDYCVHLDIIGCNVTKASSAPLPTMTEICPQPTITACPGPVTITMQQQHSMTICETPPVVLQATGSSSWRVGVAAGIPIALIVVILLSVLAAVAVYWTRRTRSIPATVDKGRRDTIVEISNKDLYTKPDKDSVEQDNTLHYNPAYNQGMVESTLVTSQEPLIRNNPSYALHITAPEHSTTGSETYEPIDRADSTLHVASNPIYGQQAAENEYAYPEIKLAPDHSDNVPTDANNYYEPTSINQ